MTDDLYRKEALEHRSRSLYGQVVLQSPPGLWIILVLLTAVGAGLLGLLFFGKVSTSDGSISLLSWLLQHGRS